MCTLIIIIGHTVTVCGGTFYLVALFVDGDAESSKGSLWDVASQGEAVSVTSFLQEAALKKIQKYALHTKETVVSTMILSLCLKRTCERSEEPILKGKLKVPSAKLKSKVNFLKIK